MLRRIPIGILLATAPLNAQSAADFATEVYPAFERAQCRLCHNDNGVASGTRLQFPPEQAAPDTVARFGLRLASLVDRKNPAQSPLFLKPTARIAHSGGERIARGGVEDAALLRWIEYLARQPETPEARPAAAPPKGVLRRLTHSQYNHTVRDLLGDETKPADQFPKEDFVNGFTNQAGGQGISPLQAEAYGKAAEKMARNAFRGGDSRGLIGCQPSPECRPAFIRRFGRRAFRRPLTGAEAARYERIFARETDFHKGAQLTVETMLRSPNFLFHLEPAAFGVASRLSYFLWDTMPDEALLTAAERGELASKAGIEKWVRRMLAGERARASLDEFLAQWMRFDRLKSAIRDRRLFPEFSGELVSAMTEETKLLFQNLIWNDGDFREFYTASYAYLSPELARLYGVPEPDGAWGKVVFPPGTGRAGVLGQGTFLALTSKPAETSPTERGIFVREHFLCQIVPPPPAGVDTTLPAVTDEKPMTTAQRLSVHLSNPSCAACHTLVDPVGMGLEHFDAIGRYREKQKVVIYPTFDEMQKKIKVEPTEYDLDLQANGVVRGLPKSGFGSPRELGRILAESAACQRCIVKQLYRYATGRPEEPEDQPAIDAALDHFRGSQFRFRELIIAIATSPGFLGPGFLADTGGAAQP